jgi:deoxyadenosine/deoxycytidine kinase
MKKMRHYQDYGQGLKKCYNNSYSTVALCMLDLNIDADCMDDNFNHETFIDCLKNIVVYQRQ